MLTGLHSVKQHFAFENVNQKGYNHSRVKSDSILFYHAKNLAMISSHNKQDFRTPPFHLHNAAKIQCILHTLKLRLTSAPQV